jgi:hypothetical protein
MITINPPQAVSLLQGRGEQLCRENLLFGNSLLGARLKITYLHTLLVQVYHNISVIVLFRYKLLLCQRNFMNHRLMAGL